MDLHTIKLVASLWSVCIPPLLSTFVWSWTLASSHNQTLLDRSHTTHHYVDGLAIPPDSSEETTREIYRSSSSPKRSIQGQIQLQLYEKPGKSSFLQNLITIFPKSNPNVRLASVMIWHFKRPRIEIVPELTLAPVHAGILVEWLVSLTLESNERIVEEILAYIDSFLAEPKTSINLIWTVL